jgi:hypothetical protein
MTNNKTKIAETLFSTNAPKDLILWALSNLPDNDKLGKNSTHENRKINHESEFIYDALGISEKDYDDNTDKLSEFIMSTIKDVQTDSEGVINLYHFLEDNYILKCIVYTKFFNICKGELSDIMLEEYKKKLLQDFAKFTPKKKNK